LSGAFTFSIEPIRIAWFPGDSMPGIYLIITQILFWRPGSLSQP
jgi:hypothetical protein